LLCFLSLPVSLLILAPLKSRVSTWNLWFASLISRQVRLPLYGLFCFVFLLPRIPTLQGKCRIGVSGPKWQARPLSERAVQEKCPHLQRRWLLKSPSDGPEAESLTPKQLRDPSCYFAVNSRHCRSRLLGPKFCAALNFISTCQLSNSVSKPLERHYSQLRVKRNIHITARN